jgi:hypothetical protein
VWDYRKATENEVWEVIGRDKFNVPDLISGIVENDKVTIIFDPLVRSIINNTNNTKDKKDKLNIWRDNWNWVNDYFDLKSFTKKLEMILQ